jgi:HK97 family phage portal protein
MSKRRRRHVASASSSTALARQAPTTPAGGWVLPVSGGFLPAAWGSNQNFWQCGYDPLQPSGSATVSACVSSYAQTVAMCPGTHWRKNPETNGRERVSTSALSRILREPNKYQSISDFLLNLTGDLYDEGAAYALAFRNTRFEISDLHLMDSRQCWPRIAETGDIFYKLGGNEVVDRMVGEKALEAVPARDVLHVRLNTRRGAPLVGIPPLTSALLEVAASNAMVAQALAFAANQGRPSGVLETDLALDSDQVSELRNRWNEQTQGINQGGTPILTRGLKWHAISMDSRDAQLAELLSISDQRVAAVYRVPLALLSLMSGQGPQGSTESLMSFWVSTGLGFTLNHLEEALGRLFGLRGWPDDYLELDTEALLRSSMKDRIEALARGVQGGIFAPNEARAKEELPEKPFGDEPRVQQQVVPLSAWGQQQQPSTPAPPAPPAAPAPPVVPDTQTEGADDHDWAQRILDAADSFDLAAA